MASASKRTIRTYLGFEVDPLDPSPIYIGDIAHSLSLLTRYGGHVPDLRSVAQHSIEVASFAWNLTYDIEFTFAALMHDASEAYMQDIVSPLKASLPDYKRAERRVQRKIAKVFGIKLTKHQAKVLSQLDKAARVLERDCATPSLTAPQAERRFYAMYRFLKRQRKLGAPPQRLFPQFIRDVKDLFFDSLRA